MANCILLSGGSSQFAKFNDELEDRLIENIGAYCPNIDRVAVFDTLASRQTLASYVSWIGATVLPRLESIKDLMITRNRWMAETLEIETTTENSKKEKSNEFNVRYIKEKLPF